MSSEDFDALRAKKAADKELRRRYGVNCPKCTELYPKRTPTILLPGQRCRVDGYIDPRQRISDETRDDVYAEFGLIRK